MSQLLVRAVPIYGRLVVMGALPVISLQEHPHLLLDEKNRLQINHMSIVSYYSLIICFFTGQHVTHTYYLE